MGKSIGKNPSKVVYYSMCNAYDVIVGNKDVEDEPYANKIVCHLHTKKFLNRILMYFEEREEYEKCAKIKDTLTDLYG